MFNWGGTIKYTRTVATTQLNRNVPSQERHFNRNTPGSEVRGRDIRAMIDGSLRLCAQQVCTRSLGQ